MVHGAQLRDAVHVDRRRRWRLPTGLVVAAVLATAGFLAPAVVPAAAAVPSWVQANPGSPPCSDACAASPPPRYAAAMAYDAATSQVVLFGGFDNSGVLNDTWVWNGSGWAQVADGGAAGCTSACPGSPGPRGYASMAYDAATSQLILFGGRFPERGDTWDWNGSAWQQLSPATSPAARDSASMAYDPGTGTLVLFGGDDTVHHRNDTWSWDGSDWSQVDASPVGCTDNCANSPSARQIAAMATDPGDQGVVLFGGETGNNTSSNLNDTWVYAGGAWAQVDASPPGCTSACAASPSARQGAAMDYDGGLGVAGDVLFGGIDASGNELGDTWTWTPAAGWTEDSPAASPSARDTSVLADDPTTGQLVLFGGESSGLLNDTWTLNSPLPPPTTQGYLLGAADGGVFAFGAAHFAGSLAGLRLNAPVAGITAAPGGGYWLVGSDGGVFALGGAPFDGSLGGTPLPAPVIGMAAVPGGPGYWLVGAGGAVYPFGGAPALGSLSGPLPGPIVGMAATPDGKGYWLVGADGSVYPFGSAGHFGSMAGHTLDAPVVGMAPAHDGAGYWLVAGDGGVFAFGSAGFAGSMGGQHLAAPVVGMAADDDGTGYWLAGSDGGVFAFGSAAFDGSMGGRPLAAPVVGVTASP